ncbi:MAG: nitrite/sulfite reductase [Acidimicrobiales bacterium]
MAFVNPYRWAGELSDVERFKLDRHPAEAVRDVVTRYSIEGPDAIYTTPGESERLKWVGLYPTKQGGNAFMLRIKVPGGHLEADQLREIGIVADAFAEGPDDSELFGNRYADITTRQDIQLHWIRIQDVPRIWQRLWDVGVTTLQACGDSARNVTCCPVAGVDVNEAFDAYPVARQISDFFTGNREYSNLPRKFKVGVTGCRENCARIEINDIGLWPARADDGTLGFNLLVGGGLSDGERMASDVDVFVRPEDAVEVCRAIAQAFGELGNRENRGLSRMRYLVQELGPEGFRAAIDERTPLELAPAGSDLTTAFRGDHVGVHAQRGEGLVYVGCSVPVGRMRGIEMVELARLAGAYGDGTVRLGTDQNFVITGVPEDRVDALVSEELIQKYSPFPGPFERGVMACTGSEFCRFAVVETKERAVKLARWLDGQLVEDPDGPSPVPISLGRRPDGGRSVAGEDRGVIRMHFSGCSAGCAQPQIADIGLRGSVAHVGEHIEEAVDIGLGGSLGPDAGFIDWVAGAVPLDATPAALSNLLVRFAEDRLSDEPFYAWARRTDNEALAGIMAGADLKGVGE